MSTDHALPSAGVATPLGADPQAGGVNFAVHAPDATDVWVCLVQTGDDGARREHRVRLPAQTAGIHHGFVPDIGEGTRYCLRAAGPWEPEAGLRFNQHKALIDPYARRIDGDPGDAAALLPYRDDGEPSDTDSLAQIPLSVVAGPPPAPEPGPRVPWERTVICEVHVGSYTARHPQVPEHLRGTYLGLAQPAVIEHLRRIGVSTVELLPVQACLTEPGVRARGMRNHWGYSTGAYFAPDPRYASRAGAEVEEFAAMVSALHAAGLEVLMDVVYNHTAEESVTGPSLSWRGLDAPGYYLLDDGADLDYTGCGNTVDCASPAALRMVLDSLRYFAGAFGVDGFRFDLASVLGRGRTATGPQGPVIEFDHRAPLLSAIGADPLLATRKLIAEPWDATAEGYRLGGFPTGWAEWNDRYRDTVRSFFAGTGTVGDLASRVSGSQDLFGATGRTPFSSINFIAAHDGFTARDLVSYRDKHNEANGEDGRDGTNNNHSVNHGVEGPTDDRAVLDLRAQHVRALLATLLLSTGTPMLLGGDELGHTQGGNNNAYCVPEGTPAADAYAVDWEAADDDLTAFVARVAAVRRAAPVLRQHEFFEGRATPDGEPDLVWFTADGTEMPTEQWQSPQVRTLQAWVDGSDVRVPGHDPSVPDKDALIVWHAGGEAELTLGGPPSCTHDWQLIVDTSQPSGEPSGGADSGGARYRSRAQVRVSGPTVLAFQQV
ncbi:glycogen debranching protein GlgX [Tsukamurella serpentis]